MIRRWFHVRAAGTVLALLVGSGGAIAAAAPLASSSPVVAASPPATVAAAPLLAASSPTLHLSVVAANNTWNNAGTVHKGDPVSTYRWLLNYDDTGNPKDTLQNCQPWKFNPPTNTNYPDGCTWPSVQSIMPGTTVGIFTQGDNSTLNHAAGLDPNALGGGKWFIQVSAPGFKLGGGYFTIDCSTGTCLVTSDPVL